MQSAGIVVNDVTVTWRNGHTALRDASFTVPGGSIAALVGVNGSGKSTLFKAIMGFVRLTSGKISVLGIPTRQALQKNLVAYVPQSEEVDWSFPVLVEDVVMMGRYGHMGMLRIAKKRDRQIVTDALERVDMVDFRHRQIGELSGGQKKRVFLARAIAQQGDVILLDEPFTGVDVKTEAKIISLLRELRAEGKTMLVSTHNLGSVTTFCDYTVMVKGTQTGVSSDVEGNYEIVVPGPGSVLVFNYLGYQPQEIAVGNRTQIDVRLAEDNNVLDDVVVIGYGTQSRRTLTSAVSKVSGADLEGVPVNSIGDALKGKVPGVRVSTANNQPGSDPVFLIRGGSSINQSNAPIIIVDGVRREMTGLNTNDIESIEILKDAASAGIYGASASNGVILVTTKKGNRAKGPQITFEAQAAWTSPATKFDLMDARDYVVTMRRALNDCPGYTYGQQVLTGANSAGIGNGDSSIWTTRYLQEGESVPRGWSSVVDPVDPSKIIVFQDNDQQSQWFDDSYWMQYYLGVNGGSDKVTYAASASYMKDGGIGINTDFSRFTFHGNTSFKITKSLTAGTTFDYSETSGNEIPSSGIGNYWTILGRGMFMPATHRDYLEDGQPGQGTNSTTISAAWFDRYYTNNYVTRRSTANFNLKWDIVDGLSAFAQIANHNSYKNSYQYLAGNAISQTRQTYEGWSQTNRLSFQAHVDYNKSFGDHNLSAMAGYDFLKRKINGMSMTVQGAESDKTPTLGAGTTPTAWTDTQTPWCQISYFGRLNYNYKEKYMLGFTMRADGSSLFAKDNRWGYFPAVSAGWVVSEEKFWNVEKFNQLKLRLSYGLTGNNNVDYYDTLGAYSVTGIYAGSGATLASTLPNLGLTWEKTKQFDIGLDMAFFNNRLRVAADYYSKKSEDLLFDVSLPDTSGYGSAMQNVGSIRFYGLEFEISSVNVSTKNFSWTTDFTYSFNANKVLSLPDEYYYKDIDGKDAWRIGGYTMSESGYRFGGTAKTKLMR